MGFPHLPQLRLCRNRRVPNWFTGMMVEVADRSWDLVTLNLHWISPLECLWGAQTISPQNPLWIIICAMPPTHPWWLTFLHNPFGSWHCLLRLGELGQSQLNQPLRFLKSHQHPCPHYFFLLPMHNAHYFSKDESWLLNNQPIMLHSLSSHSQEAIWHLWHTLLPNPWQFASSWVLSLAGAAF